MVRWSAQDRGAAVARRTVPRRVGFGVAGVALVGGFVLWVTLQPTPVDAPHRDLVARVLDGVHGIGVPAWFGYAQLEFTANVLLFVPLGFFLALLFPPHLGWLGAVVGIALSAVVESAQAVWLPMRYASLLDLLANGVGACAGAALGVWCVRAAMSRYEVRPSSS